eukprot:gnl/MRDRNA2_/MRDRNA2_80929_c1_seq1.p1 gnl/MRDRNA2_/MRDRNA2_80929_c1~~gnl/MRDRNA2_/MRDRNA2_80929_c1_seq1.p1  ORF type:complete len:272 (-),score=39.74 gnl/MRDRNA2_/MRDRNA2_80929_c1_seq1:207-1022(-)
MSGGYENDTIEITSTVGENISKMEMNKLMSGFGEVTWVHMGYGGALNPFVRFKNCDAATRALTAIKQGRVICRNIVLSGDWKARGKSTRVAGREEEPAVTDRKSQSALEDGPSHLAIEDGKFKEKSRLLTGESETMRGVAIGSSRELCGLPPHATNSKGHKKKAPPKRSSPKRYASKSRSRSKYGRRGRGGRDRHDAERPVRDRDSREASRRRGEGRSVYNNYKYPSEKPPKEKSNTDQKKNLDKEKKDTDEQDDLDLSGLTYPDGTPMFV